MATTEEEEPWKKLPTRKRSDAPAPKPGTRNRNDSKSTRDGGAMIGTETLGNGPDTVNTQLGLLDTKILDITSGDEPTVTSLQDSTAHMKHPRVTRFLYFYFMLGV